MQNSCMHELQLNLNHILLDFSTALGYTLMKYMHEGCWILGVWGVGKYPEDFRNMQITCKNIPFAFKLSL